MVNDAHSTHDWRHSVIRNRLALLFVMAALATAGGQPLGAQGTSVCLAADNQTAFLGVVLSKFLSGTDAANTSLRQKMNMPQVAANSISLVTDSRTCDKAIPAINTAQGQTQTRRLYVYKLGNSRFGVIEQADSPVAGTNGGGSTTVWYFDNKWNYISAGEL